VRQEPAVLPRRRSRVDSGRVADDAVEDSHAGPLRSMVGSRDLCGSRLPR
jgi:hypothetical protein